MVKIPFDSLNEERSDSKLEGIYHRGQSNVWDGREVLLELVERYGDPNLSPEKLEAVKNIFSVILHGEYAAWTISSDLAMQIEDIDAKLAATSQAHDEARHFYVMQDYLRYLGHTPAKINPATEKILDLTMNANSLPKKLLGMQLMIEPIALTIFRLVIESKVEPVLCDLLSYYEKDEARHVALGVKYLPRLIKKMSYTDIIDLIAWQVKILLLEVDSLEQLRSDFEKLGFDPDTVFKCAEDRHVAALKELAEQFGIRYPIWEPLRKIVGLKKKVVFEKTTLSQQLRKIYG